MSISVFSHDRISMSQKERHVLKIMHAVLRGERRQAEAARLLDKSTRQVRRILRRLQTGGDAALVHGLRGKLSNHQPDPTLRRAVVAAYRQHYADFGPTFAGEKLAEHGLHVGAPTLRRCRRTVATATTPGNAPPSSPPTCLLRRAGAEGCLDSRLVRGTRRGGGPQQQD